MLRAMQERLRNLISAAGNSYTALVLLLLVLRMTPLGSQWWLRLAGNFLPFWFLPLLLLAPAVLLLSRSRAAKVLICLPCLIFVVLYGNRFLPGPAAASSGENGATFTVMTYNVTRGDPGVEEILSIIEGEKADVVALQEVSPEVAEALPRLGDRYPYQALHPTPDGYSGCGVLSRFPLGDDEAFPLVEEMHLSQRLVLEVGGESLHLFNAHLQPPRVPGERLGGSLLFVPTRYDTTIQDQELARLLEEVDGAKGPVVVVGDFNMTEGSPGYSQITRRLVDAYREAGWGFGHTFPDREARLIPTPFPLLRIDYVFHSADLVAQRAEVGDRGGPNHRFLVAELSF
jgi:vancomycin resistance protein VanJ